MPLRKTRTLKMCLAALAPWLCIISFGALPTYADEGLPSSDTCTGTPRQCEQERQNTELCKRQRNIIDELNQAIADYEREIQSSSKAIADMKRVLADSRKPGAAPPDINRLKAQGFAGRGVVGPGADKGPNIRDAVNYFEQWWHFYHYQTGVGFMSDRANELKKVIAARKKELGLGENDKLPKAEQDALDRSEGPLEMMAMGRADYMLEIKRSTIFVDQLRERIKSARRQIDVLIKTSPPNCPSGTPASGGKQTATSGAEGSGSGTGEPADSSGGSGPTGPRSAADGDSGGSSATCSTAQAYAYAPGAVIVPKPADPRCGAPCPPLSGWHLPAGARCGGGSTTQGSGAGGKTQPAGGGNGTGGPAPSTPSAGNSGGGSGCGPAPSCSKDCRPVGYQCLNGEWLGGYCSCSKLP